MDDDLPAYTRYAKSLHAALCEHAQCSCTKPSQAHQHWARVRLRPIHRFVEGQLVPFEMLFSASPDPITSGNHSWQSVKIMVRSKNAFPKSVQFKQGDATINLSEPAVIEDSDLVEGSLCKFISSPSGSLVCFRLDRGRLMALREQENLPEGYKPEPGLGLQLSDALDGYKLRHGMRPLLAYVLAKTVWHYYDSDWMNFGWTKHNIYFMAETTNGYEIKYLCRPYVHVNLNTSHGRPPEYRQVFGMMHRYPRVLALGILLLQLSTADPIRLEGHPDNWDSKMANEQLELLKGYIQSSKLESDCNFPYYRAALKKCFDIKLFKDAPFNPERPEENLDQRRSIFYDEIVDRLKRFIAGAELHAEFDEIEHTPLIPKKEPKTTPMTPAHAVSTMISWPPSSNGNRSASEAWLQEIEFINRGLKDDIRRAGSTDHLKIAILDTGFCRDAPSFYLPGRLDRIKKWEDFVPKVNSLEPVDSDGHGTHTLALLLQVAPSADIFVARVAENSQELETSIDNICEAIRTAAMVWDVDFVSMSFGFTRHVEKIEQAISDACHHKKSAITFFAAAANNGLNAREMFPANLGPPVIAIRGTSDLGAFEPKFNPQPSTEGPVFGTLGVDVLSDWIGEKSRRSMSGCSVATPVAVGIASMLFDYAASRTSKFQPSDLRLMRTRRGIFELFKEIGVYSGAGRYYIAPFSWFQESDDVRQARLKRAIGLHPGCW
ncbi:subtilisin-like protein [Thozetella sp. PMI_491]|nr:subtilisin-like protein [Thozetella sp. PMI_491]